MAVSDPLIDTVFDGRYKIVRKLGSGGMANVYLAEDQELGRRVAIKILNDRHAGDEQFVERFRREAKHAAGLSHPNVVSIYDRGEAEGTYYIAMEYVEGRTLKELILTRGPAPIGTAIDYTRQVLSALKFAHRNGVVHRDIKPHNVVVDREGRVKVMDFGIARAGAASQLTEAGSIVGTAQYLSPEQARGAPVDQSSDLYSVGIVLYELLTGTVPFTGETPVEIAMKHLQATPEPPSARRPEVPRDLDMVVLRALAKDPADRYRSAEEMDAELARVARGLGVTSQTAEAATTVLSGASTAPTTIRPAPAAVARPREPGRYYEYETPPPRRSLWPWLLGVGALLAVLVGGWFAYQALQDQLAQTRPVAVPDVVGIKELLAVKQIRDQGLVAKVLRQPSSDTEAGYVFEQDPQPGDKLSRGSFVTVTVSTGKPKVQVPSLVGDRRDDAVQKLADAGLKPNVVEVPSEKEEGTVTGQSPRAGETVVEGTTVRINVSRGPKPVAVPPVVGQLYESAASTLQAAGFAVARTPVDSTEPAGTVVAQDPAGNTTAPKGSTVKLQVSKGPTTSTVPDVTSLDQASARDQLLASGFKVKAQRQDTGDPSLDGYVISQDPPGLTEAAPGTTVTIVVGRYAGPPPATTTQTTATTP